jgi:hypothetical protein
MKNVRSNLLRGAANGMAEAGAVVELGKAIRGHSKFCAAAGLRGIEIDLQGDGGGSVADFGEALSGERGRQSPARMCMRWPWGQWCGTGSHEKQKKMEINGESCSLR